MKKLIITLVFLLTALATLNHVYACTSFAVYSEAPIYAMNFDYPQTELRFVIEENSKNVQEILQAEENKKLDQLRNLTLHNILADVDGNDEAAAAAMKNVEGGGKGSESNITYLIILALIAALFLVEYLVKSKRKTT